MAQAPDLEGAQQALRNAVQRCQQENIRTFVLGGGHETAFAHGAGVLDAFLQAKVGIVNFDAHLDLRHADQATSGTPLVEDLFCATAQAQLAQFVANLDVIYLTIDLDVLPVWEMPGVSAPAALGVPLATLLNLIEPLCRSGKLQAVDMVEFNPRFDDDGRAARVAARLGWQIAHWWH